MIGMIEIPGPLYIVCFCLECQRAWVLMAWPTGRYSWPRVFICAPCARAIDVSE